MKIKNIYLLFGFVLFMPFYMHAFIYQIQVMRKWIEQANQYHYVVGFSDWHDKLTLVSQEQRAYLDNLFKGCNVCTTQIIVEDLSTNQLNERAICGQFGIDTRGGILGGLAQDCRQKGLQVENIEYRYCRVASLSPVLHHTKQDLHTLASTSGIDLATVVDEVGAIIEQVKQFDGSSHVTDHYQRLIDRVQAESKRLHLDTNELVSVAEYLSMHTKQGQRLQLIKDLLTFDSALLDIKLTHSVTTNFDKEVIFAVAGGTHVERSFQVLASLGYEYVFQSKITSKREYDLKKCVGSQVHDRAYCLQPEPVDLQVIEQFLP